MAFAVGELGLRLHDFYDMPWYEFCLKRYAYYRIDKEKWKHTRLLAHQTAISSHSKPNPSWFGKGCLERYMPLESGKINKVTNHNREIFIKEYQEYLLKKNSKNGVYRENRG